MTSSCEYMYEVVITLNNAAVSLLVQQQRYRDAMETLTEALTTLKILFHRMELETQYIEQHRMLIVNGSSLVEQQHAATIHSNIVNEYIVMAQSYLSNASKRLARPRKQHNNTKRKTLTNNIDNLIVSNVANIDDIANVINRFSIGSNDELKQQHIFRIDCDRSYHDHEIWENIDIQFVSTILLYNCGMACELGCTLMSHPCSDSISNSNSTHNAIIEKTKLRESSMRYYQLAFQTICRHLEQYSSTLCPQMNTNEVTDLTKIVWLSLQVSRCLQHACIDCGMQVEAAATYREHYHLYELFSTIRNEFEKIPIVKAIAASAA